jgi:uracil-DNA glycosylase family 4
MSEVYGPICHEYGIRGYGDPSEGVIIVGIAPGRDEIERSGKPFTGQSGKLLDASLENAGWPRSKVYTTNTICWWNNKPTPIEIERCGPRFRSELLELKPKLIVTAGVIANETVMGRKRPKGSRGSINWSDYWKCYVLDTHHPSAALRLS